MTVVFIRCSYVPAGMVLDFHAASLCSFPACTHMAVGGMRRSIQPELLPFYPSPSFPTNKSSRNCWYRCQSIFNQYIYIIFIIPEYRSAYYFISVVIIILHRLLGIWKKLLLNCCCYWRPSHGSITVKCVMIVSNPLSSVAVFVSIPAEVMRHLFPSCGSHTESRGSHYPRPMQFFNAGHPKGPTSDVAYRSPCFHGSAYCLKATLKSLCYDWWLN